MLVLSRKRNEAIVINGQITVCVVDIRGDKVRIGVDAPRDVRVDRMEVHRERMRKEDDNRQLACRQSVAPSEGLVNP